MTWILTKVNDDTFIKSSEDIRWIEWKDGRGHKLHEEPEINRSLMMSPFSESHTWLTTAISRFTKNNENNFEFETINSTYKLNKINDDMQKQEHSETTISISHTETTGEVIRKISTAIEKFGISINVVDIQPEHVEYKIDILK